MKQLNYVEKQAVMDAMFAMHQSPSGYRSTWKNIPMGNYERIKQFIDFTKYYVIFRGPRPRLGQCSTLKRDAKAFDVYQRSRRDMELLRTEREAFQRGVRWANNRSH